jgi:hypothetical protein
MNDIEPLMISLSVLNAEIRRIFDNEESFLKRFGKGSIMDLMEVSFTSQYLKISYVLDCGQHVCDTVKMSDYLDWCLNPLQN